MNHLQGRVDGIHTVSQYYLTVISQRDADAEGRLPSEPQFKEKKMLIMQFRFGIIRRIKSKFCFKTNSSADGSS